MERQYADSEAFGFEDPFATFAEALDEQSWGEAFDPGGSVFASEGDAFAPDMAALQTLLELESGEGSDLAERAKGAAALVAGPILRRGSAGPAVEALQRALARLGRAVAADGRFGPGTERALRAFQASNGMNADGIAGSQTKAALARALGGAPPAPLPSLPIRPSPGQARRLVVAQHPLFRSHRGTAPDLVLRWNDLGLASEVDVVVHFHGYSGRQAGMRIDRDKEPNSGLDFADPANPASAGRREPTIGVLPRGNYFGGNSGAGFDFPALVRPGALDALIRDSLERVGRELGRTLSMRRLILTGHSGGGAPVSAILAHSDPDEVHVFDGTYGSGANIARWAERRIARELTNSGLVPPAMRILYRPGTQTAPQAEAIGQAVCRALAPAAAAGLRRRFRIDATRVGHNEVPAAFGWRLLTDSGADLPNATSRNCPGAPIPEAEADWRGESASWNYPSQEASGMQEFRDVSQDRSFASYDEDEGEHLDAISGEELGWLDLETGQATEFGLGETDRYQFAPDLLEAADHLDQLDFEPEFEPLEPEAFDPELEWFEPEAFDPELEWFEPGAGELYDTQGKWFGHGESAWSAGEYFEPKDHVYEAFEAAEAKWESSEAQFEGAYALASDAFAADMFALEAMLEAEADSPGLADRLKGVAAFVVGPTLQRGSRGPAVEALQRALIQLGQLSGAAEGQFGPVTDRAVRSFQSKDGLTSDGIVGPRTKAAIAAALGRGLLPNPFPGPGPSPAPMPVPPQPSRSTSGLCDMIAKIAEQEYARWHSPAKLRETDSAAVPILQRYYREGVKMNIKAAELQDTSWQASHPWSAVFISFVMRSAGAGSWFRYAAAHQTYVAAARKNRLQGDIANPFWAYRATEVAPQVGDLVCASRDNSGATYDTIGDPGKTFKTHCDVVTEVRPGSLRVIGGNVNQNVDAKTIATLPDGRIDLSGKQARFFAVLRCRGDASGSAPAPQPAPSPVPSPGPVAPGRRSGKKLTPAQFVAAYWHLAKASEAKFGVPALVTMGQAAVESGWGESAPRFNFFGIKARESDPADTRQLLRTTEVYATPDKKLPRLVEVKPRPDGRYTYVVDDWFRAYPDAETAFYAHGALLRKPRYAKAFGYLSDPYAFLSEVARAGYATGPQYAKVVHGAMRMIEKIAGR